MTAREELDDLLRHPGWLRVREYFRQQWGTKAYATKVKGILGSALPFNEKQIQLEVMDKVSDELNALMMWPEQQIRVMEQQLAHEAELPSLSRRGTL